jgi:hypothetical protein
MEVQPAGETGSDDELFLASLPLRHLSVFLKRRAGLKFKTIAKLLGVTPARASAIYRETCRRQMDFDEDTSHPHRGLSSRARHALIRAGLPLAGREAVKAAILAGSLSVKTVTHLGKVTFAEICAWVGISVGSAKRCPHCGQRLKNQQGE